LKLLMCQKNFLKQKFGETLQTALTRSGSFWNFPTLLWKSLFRFDREERAIAQKVAGDVRYLMNQNPRWRLSDLEKHVQLFCRRRLGLKGI